MHRIGSVLDEKRRKSDALFGRDPTDDDRDRQAYDRRDNPGLAQVGLSPSASSNRPCRSGSLGRATRWYFHVTRIDRRRVTNAVPGQFGLDNPYRAAPKPSLEMTIIRSGVLSFARAASRKSPARLSSSVSFPPALLESVRQMATSESTKHHFMVYAPDHTDPETQQRRLSHRPEHLDRVRALTTTGILSVYRCGVFRG